MKQQQRHFIHISICKILSSNLCCEKRNINNIVIIIIIIIIAFWMFAFLTVLQPSGTDVQREAGNFGSKSFAAIWNTGGECFLPLFLSYNVDCFYLADV